MEKGEGMDMSMAVEGLIDLFDSIDGTSRVTFIRILVTKMKDYEVDLILEVIDQTRRSNDDLDIEADDIVFKKETEDTEEYENYNDGQIVESNGGSHIEVYDNSVKIEPEEDENEIYNDIAVEVELEEVGNDNVDSEHLKETTINNFGEVEMRDPHAPVEENEMFRKGLEKKSFSCNSCLDVFSSRINLKKHNETYHESYGCTKCGKFYSSKNSLSVHMANVHRAPSICPICTKSFKQKNNLQVHMQTVHINEESLVSPSADLIKMKQENEIFKDKEIKPFRLKTHECNDCGKLYSSKNSLSVHIANVHREPSHCPQCNKSFKQKNYLQIHMKKVHTLT